MDLARKEYATSFVPSIAPSHLLIIAALIAAQIAGLYAMGLPWICKCGHVALWYANASGPETSQHLTDWYSFTHVIHGLAFYFLLWLVAPNAPIGLRLAASVGLEIGWELIENTPMIIERYRRGGLAQGYFGDSIVNSIADTLAMVLGFFMAWKLPVWISIAFILATEILLLYWIRDNLLLNIIQLLYPSEALTRWQSGK